MRRSFQIGTVVALVRFGFLRPPAVRRLFQVSDSASSYLDVVESHYTSGRLTRLVGQAMSRAVWWYNRDVTTGRPSRRR